MEGNMKKKIIVLIGILSILLLGLGALILIRSNQKKAVHNVNPPSLLEGMKAITFEEGKETPKVLTEEEMKEGIWYEYIAQESGTEEGGTSRWANAMTRDGSMWVWIPRYAYKIEWDKSQKTGKIEVVFLQGTTNYDKEGRDVTKLGYTVHPAFQNGEKNQYANGEWDKEIPGIWVAKFEAGFANQENTASEKIEKVDTNLVYTRNSKNVFGEIKEGETKIPYPVFMGKTYSYNNIAIGEIYDLAQALKQEGNPYGFNQTVDSHLMKNSEWGACSYLAHSQYGRNGSKVSINNLEVSKAIPGAETVTGYAGNTDSATPNSIEKVEDLLQDHYLDQSYAWYTKEGKLGSTTGNLYGIYDMNGGSSEYTAGYIDKINQETAQIHAKSLVQNTISTKYCTIYKASTENAASLNLNYEANQAIYGDAIAETSTQGNGYTSWFGETSIYIRENAGFFLRSGDYSRGKYSGLFDFENHSGHSFGSYSFRCVLIENKAKETKR